MDTREIVELFTLGAMCAVMALAIRQLIQRDKKVRELRGQITTQCKGVAEVPGGAAVIFSYEEAGGNSRHGSFFIWMKDGELFVSRILVLGKAKHLQAYFAAPYLCVSLKDVVECTRDKENINLLMMGITLEITIYCHTDVAAGKCQETIQKEIAKYSKAA